MSFAAELTVAARARGIPVLLDAYRGVAPVLEAGVDILKINAAELRELAGNADTGAAAAALFARYPKTACLAVTDGAGAARLFLRSADSATSWRFPLPKLPRIVNPIGAGDCTAGVFLLRLTQVMAAANGTATALPPTGIVEAFRDALACACASCLEERPAQFATSVAARFRDEITPVRE
jgi:sugar/nucleoside kinase (ribokinase family)